jgi:Flp pilus assembly protein TadG
MPSFLSDSRGSVSIMMGLGLVLVATATGAAVDYSMATKNRHTLQNAADAAVLAAAAMPEATNDERLKRARIAFEESRFCETHSCREAVVSMNGDAVVIDASADISTSLLRIAGIDTVNVGVSARAVPAEERTVEVAMMLDFSGSMSVNNKYQDMAAAAQEFLEQAGDQPDDTLSVAVVPFSEYVLTPMEGAYLFDTVAGTPLNAGLVVGCTLNRAHPHSTNVATPTSATVGSLWPVTSYSVGGNVSGATFSDPYQPPTFPTVTWTYNHPDMPDPLQYEIVAIDTDPNGPVGEIVLASWTGVAPNVTLTFDGLDRFYLESTAVNGTPDAILMNSAPKPDISPFANFGGYADSTDWVPGDDTGLPPSFSAALLDETLNAGCSEYATNRLWVRALSDELDNLKDAIGDMRPIGLTNIALALDIGWHALTPEPPFEQSSSDGNVQRVAILLTDGVQTVAAHGADGTVSINSANTNIAESCAAMKAQEIEIFTIAFAIQDQFTRDLLRDCASGAPYYFEPNQGGDLNDVFSAIFNKIIAAQVRLTG